MKKFLTLSALALLFTACSTDDTGVAQEGQNAIKYDSNTADDSGDAYRGDIYRMAGTTECAENLQGYVYADGLMNPNIVFVAQADNVYAVKATFSVTLEIQPLSDCDDMDSNIGAVTSRQVSVTAFNASPSISVPSAQLGGCYKWRFVVEGYKMNQRLPFCTTSSEWYEAPLF